MVRTHSNLASLRSRRIASIVLLGLLCVTQPAFSNIKVFACEPEWKALTEILGGEHVEVFSATSAFQDPHHIEARPSLIAKTRQADLLVCTGAELEIGWLPLLLRQSGNANIQRDETGYFLAAAQVDRIEIPTDIDRSQGDVHASGNPHVHWDPYRLIAIAKALTERLQIVDPDNAHRYEQAYQKFANLWHEQIQAWELHRSSLKGKKAIVYHKNWSYLLNWLQIETVGDLEPKPGIPPTSAHLAHLLDIARSTEVDYILIANYQNDRGARWLSDKTGIPVIRLPFTVGGSEQANDLFTLYDEVLTALIQK